MGKVIIPEDDIHIVECAVILSHGGILQCEFVHAQFREVFLGQDLCDLTAPVGPEIEAYHCVICRNGGKGLIVFTSDDDGLDELICGVFRIGRLNGICCGSCHGAQSIDHGIVGKLNPFPALVTVHGIIPSNDRCYFTCRTF